MAAVEVPNRQVALITHHQLRYRELCNIPGMTPLLYIQSSDADMYILEALATPRNLLGMSSSDMSDAMC